MKLILVLSFLFLATSAFATQLAISSVSTLIPNPNIYTVTDNNQRAAVQTVNIQNSGTSVTVTITVYCNQNTNVFAQVYLYDSAGNLIQQSGNVRIVRNCQGGNSGTGSVSLNNVQISQIAKVSVILS